MSGVCKISDFGISKRMDDINGIGASTSMQGTIFWMAPEVIDTPKKGYDKKIDIWSVGCVVLEMWAGKRPWSGDEAIAVILKVSDWKYLYFHPLNGFMCSFTSPNYLLLCQTTLFCLHWHTISGTYASPCTSTSNLISQIIC